MRMPILVLTTVGVDFDAQAFAEQLVESGSAACVNVIDRISSTYRWEGKVARDSEQLVIIKTTRDRLEDLRREVLARHSYEVPEFVVLVVDSLSDAYRDWLFASVGDSTTRT